MSLIVKLCIATSLITAVIMSSANAYDVNVPKFSEKAQAGEKIFNTNCIACHGKNAMGTEQGPPLIHPFYRPGHHDNDAMRRGIMTGVIAHHWDFGDMPPVEGISLFDSNRVIAYIRELQRANGVK